VAGTPDAEAFEKIKLKAQIDSGHLYEMLLSRNRMLTMELQNVLLAIALAKVNIVSPSILDHADLEGMWMEEPKGLAMIAKYFTNLRK